MDYLTDSGDTVSADRIEIDSGLLRDQARAVTAAASGVDEARQAASSMNLTGGAFGVMCAFLVPPAMLLTDAASSMLTQASEMLVREAGALRGAADDFDDLERGISNELRRLGGGLGMQ